MLTKKRLLAIAGGALVVVAGFLALAVRDAFAVRADLERARSILSLARATPDNVNVADLRVALDRASIPLARAVARAHAFPLRLLAHVPIAGRSARAAAGLTEAVSLAVQSGISATDALGSFPQRNGTLSFGLRNGTLDLAPWVRARSGLQRARDLAEQARARFGALPDTWVLGQLQRARTDLDAKLPDLEHATASAADAAQLIPSMFGADGPRRYLVVLQNLAEARATGGLPGGFLVIEAIQGRMKLTRVVSDVELHPADHPVPMPAWFRTRYDRFETRKLWSNANMEPDFPTTAPLMARLFARTGGSHVDGVIATDPVGLREVLRVTGPVAGPRGVRLEAASIARLILSTEYRLFPKIEQAEARKAFLVDIAERIWKRLVGTADARGAAGAFGRAARARHLMLWSAIPSDQAAFERLGLAGAFPDFAAAAASPDFAASSAAPDASGPDASGPDASGPGAGRPVPGAGASFAGVVTQNGSAGKMDYYLRRVQELSITPRPDGSAGFHLLLTLRNTGPARGIPDYVLGPIHNVREYAPGLTRVYVSVYLPLGALVDTFRVQDKRALFESEVSPRAQILSTFIPIPPGRSRTVEINWEQPGAQVGTGRARLLDFTLLRQPTAAPDVVSLGASTPSGYRSRLLSAGGEIAGGRLVWQPDGDQPAHLRLEISRPLWGRLTDWVTNRGG